ncbi:ribosome biogenesis GTPase Der [Riemerella anatipestifer]|uniref:GTPase Der n=1 Tax=Riemerella anatipestifer (strain ATCC 11845 / DSM 15868 / JCM 9532 / NCTC 11014) TaxID=693978 RepID=E4TCJ5_RIEAD|nr:ribosome biogenesis GTPase Der [Riemerella anatipestifer]ADQ82504.1 ribosome-associated GTPase EngA [Riemerella anatipestifer ATCC 11845 = DSM 15868]ADZ12001.1 Predicted GTPase [Riemerella anatipestifer RA-GD]AFD56511.1 ribosome-associated GTPase enga [Riemerella anatipestifer ATCC 11845 = DSM 15868]AKP69699.1 ribosome-associated GTPase enga [Riemerella anatipestifer]AKP71608.1 ribosome-associated GTPase enga [Riemerella anatipestifer]
MSNIVAIVGRPNVGKSTLFNRLLERREAIVDSVAGVTRDRHYGKSEWNGVEFTVIDTGGYDVGTDDIFEEEIRHQVQLAVDEATSIIFMLNVEEGLTDTDQEIHELLRRSNKPIYIVVNKVDSAKEELPATEFYQLGIEKYYTLSSATGSGTGDLLDAVVADFPTTEYKDPFDGLPRITIAGRPNVGKSTLTNALLDNKRNIVTDIAGTTRDSIETIYNKFGHEFVLVDTAGMRKKSKVSENLEFYSVMRSVRAIEHSDVVVIMVDATQGWESQDMNIFGIAQKNRKGIVILVNKWDLVEKETNTMRDFENNIKKRIGQFSDVPILFISALTKQRILKAVEVAMEVYENRKKKIKTSKLNEVMLPVFEHTPPPAIKGKYIKIKYCVQLPTPSPQFVFFCNLPQYVKEPYKRFTENQLRKEFGFTGAPIEVYFRQK